MLLAIADAALYEAKSGGKSCCRMASVETNLVALRRLQDRLQDKSAPPAATSEAAA
jgi:hypothetical protein